jgi:lipoate-protein ligase B
LSRPGIDLLVREGLTPYDEAHALQLDLVEQRKSGAIRDTLILVEHPAVVTLGRNASTDGLLVPFAELERAGVELRRVERGGQATFHGPGQIVGYPIVDLHGLGLGVATYVHNLEQVMIDAAAALGVEAFRRDEVVGVFTDAGKLGAIGVRVTRGVTFHGFAFNVATNLDHYRFIVPCGMTGMPVTSVTALLDVDARATLRSPQPLEAPTDQKGEVGQTMSRARQSIVSAFCDVFGFDLSG